MVAVGVALVAHVDPELTEQMHLQVRVRVWQGGICSAVFKFGIVLMTYLKKPCIVTPLSASKSESVGKPMISTQTCPMIYGWEIHG